MSRPCPFCKAPLADDALFCGACGNRLPSDRPADSRPPPCLDKSFEIRLAKPAAFCAGRRSPLEVRFQAAEDVFARVSFRLLCADREVAGYELDDRPGTAERRVLLQVTPQNPGGAALELQTVLQADFSCESEVYVTRFVAAVDDVPSGASTLNFAPNFMTDRAGRNEIGTMNINISGDAIGSKPLDVSRYEAVLSPQPVTAELHTSPSRLTLRAEDGRTVQLLSDGEITFGRNQDNLVVARLYGADGTLDRASNEQNLSRFHFKLVRRNGAAYIVDAGSTFGTRLDGVSVDASSGIRLESRRNATVDIGRAGVELRYDVRVESDGWMGASGLTMTRLDGAPETVVAVWRGRVGFAGGSFQHSGGHWIFTDAAGKSVGLGLFSRVCIGEVPMRVMPFHKPFL